MCGIAGWYDKNINLKDAQTVLTEMSASMSRRGPDDSGSYVENNIALLHRRLAVIDVENGSQPMTKALGERECTIAYNGELYNTAELREYLSSKGHEFKTASDTEVVLTAYLHWGEECVYRLNGIFAFAVWDKQNQELFLARDRIGVKPLFFYEYGGGLIFASEIKTLLRNPLVPPRVDEEGLSELFLIGPGRTLGQGIYKGVGEILPGEYAVFNGEHLKRRRYFKLQAHEHTSDTKQSIREVRELLTDSIERQLVSDVPLCCFLSGGLDSSIISYTAAEYNRRNGLAPIDTYSVDYTDNSKYFQKSLFQPTPDSEFIGIMVDAIGSKHHSVTIDNYDLFRALLSAVDARDLPGMVDVDSSLLLFCGKIKKDFTVGLSGECADELFGGHPWYHNKSILFDDNFPWSRSLDIRRSILRKDFLPHGEEYVRQRYLDTCRKTEKLKSDSRLDARMREMFSLNFHWFMQTLLDRKDRMSMYNGLEVRVPFCDYRIVDYAFNLPWSIKALGGREKGIVRAAFQGLLPDSIIERKKSPYPKTHNPLYFELCATKAREIIYDNTSPLYDIIDPEGVESIIQNPDQISSPWYGQLMRAPQILAYIIQLDYWFRKNTVSIEI
ncbi:MAG: asparagine synthase (glutamine-hydrolyzing) [Clostridia bacterium]|nr:asparagine synthase (glutamine-hydrolyzing) [Clostridia bacterium]